MQELWAIRRHQNTPTTTHHLASNPWYVVKVVAAPNAGETVPGNCVNRVAALAAALRDAQTHGLIVVWLGDLDGELTLLLTPR